MATQTEIINIALRKLGANKLTTDIDSTTDKNAIIMKDVYTQSLSSLLAESFWTFATKRDELVIASGEENEWSKYDLDYIYDVPTDLIRLIGWSDESAVVRREGEFFLSDVGGDEDGDALGVLYVYLNDTETTYPSYFVEALADKLALDTSYAIVQSGPKTERLEERYRISLRKAKSIDGQGQTQQTPKADAWVNAKYNGNALQGRSNIYYRS